MNSLIRRFRYPAAVLALLAASAAGAHAQAQVQARPPAQAPVESQVTIAASQGLYRTDRNRRLLDQAVRGFGYSPERLTRRQRAAIGDAFLRIVPEAEAGYYRLNRAQAAAIVYMALVHRRGDWRDDPYGPGRYDRDPSGRDSHDRDTYDRDRYPRGGSCGDVARRVYDLSNALSTPEYGEGMFLTDQEKQRARLAAREVQRAALSCGDTRMAERADQVIRAVAAMLPNRRDVQRLVDQMKADLRDDDSYRDRSGY